MSLARKTAKLILPLLVLLLAAAVAFYIIKTRPGKKPPAAKEKSWPVQAISLKLELNRPQYILYGVFEPGHESTLTSTINADVNEVEVYEGDKVTKDKELLALDRSDVDLLFEQKKSDLDGVTAQLGTEQAELARFYKLKKSRLKSESAVSKQQATVNKLIAQKKMLEAQLEQIRKDQARAQVKSPFNAIITQVFVSPGNRVRPGDKLLSLYDVDKIQVRAQLPNNILSVVRALLQKGDLIKAYGEIDANKISTVLSRVAGKVAASAVGVDAIFNLDKGGFEFGVGRSIKLTMELPAKEETFALPFTALYGLDTVYVINNQRLKPVKIIKHGVRYTPDKTFILATSKELKPGDKIISTQLPNAITGLKVSIAK